MQHSTSNSTWSDHLTTWAHLYWPPVIWAEHLGPAADDHHPAPALLSRLCQPRPPVDPAHLGMGRKIRKILKQKLKNN